MNALNACNSRARVYFLFVDDTTTTSCPLIFDIEIALRFFVTRGRAKD